MTHYAVAYMDYSENNLTIELVEANSIAEAIGKHSEINFDNLTKALTEDGIDPDDIDKIQESFFNADQYIAVAVIPAPATTVEKG